MRKLLYLALLAIVACVCLLLFCLPGFGQQGPVMTPQVNSTYYVKQVSGFYPTIQSAVTKACSASVGAIVNIPAGSSPSDTIGAVTGGCTNVAIEDGRLPLPRTCYAWNGSAYATSSCYPGGAGSLPTDAVVFGLSPSTSRAATSTDFATVVKSASGCDTSGNTWEPHSGTCIPSSGSGLTGQTPTFLPQAATATTSTSSSHFFEAADHSYSGLQNPFWLENSVPNVLALGPTFTKWTLHTSLSNDNGSAYSLPGSSSSVAAWTFTHNAWGGNAGMGGEESRTSQVFGDSYNGALVTAGIKQTWIHNTSGFGIGDFQGFQFDNLCLAGVSYGSDEGCKNYLRIGETAPDWTGTIAGGTNTAPTFTTSGGCFGLENQACSPIPGGWMIDSSVVRGTGLATGISFGVTPCSIAWASTITTNFAPPAAGAWGCKIGANLTSSTPWESPVSQTFTLQAGSGAFSVGDHACVIGSNFTEQNIISAVSGTAGTQTITIPLAMPETDVIIAKGDCMALSPDADQAAGIQYALPVVSIDGSTLIATWENYSRNDRLDWQTGSHWSHFDGGASSGIHLYATARILKVDTTQPNQLAWNPGNQIPTLSPNSYFNVGDVLWSAHPEGQLVTGLDVNAIQNMPGGPRGVMSHIGGHGTNADSFAFYGENTEPTSSYIPYGGPLNEPQFINQVGVFDSFLTANTTPNSSLFYFNNHQTGQTAYNILRDPSWGTLSLQSDGLHWDNDIRGVSFYGAGLVQGTLGLQAGAGTGNASNAGVRFDWGTTALQSPVWLAPHCIPGHTDGYLALTYQGASRTAGGGDYCATPDASLLLRNLFVADDGAGHNGQISFGTNYGLLDILMYDGGAGLRYGWGLTSGTMNFVVPSLANAGGHFAFTDGGDLAAGNSLFYMTRAASGLPSGTVFGWSSTVDAGAALDTGISRCGAGHLCVGDGTAGSQNGELDTVNATITSLVAGTVGADRLANKVTANTDLAGFLTLAGGTATYTFGVGYFHAPACVASDNTAINPVQVVTTTTTLTVNGTGTDSVSYICVTR